MDKAKKSDSFSPVLYCLRQSHFLHRQTAASPTMQQFVARLVASRDLELDAPELDLQLVHPVRNERLLITALYPGAILVARMVWARAHWWEDLLIIFHVDAGVWVPEEIRYAPHLWAAYRQTVSADGALDDYGLPRLAGITEYVAGQLTADGWLEHARVPEATETAASEQTEKNEGLVDSESTIWD